MRDSLGDSFEKIIGQNLVVPKLYAISAMSTRFCVYEYDKETNTLSPHPISRHPSFMIDVAPAYRWNYELLEDEGEQKMRKLMLEVKRMCQVITECTSFKVVFADPSLRSFQLHIWRIRDNQQNFLHSVLVS